MGLSSQWYASRYQPWWGADTPPWQNLGRTLAEPWQIGLQPHSALGSAAGLPRVSQGPRGPTHAPAHAPAPSPLSTQKRLPFYLQGLQKCYW